MENKELVIIANKAKEYAYSPYSNLKVGAALVTDDDKIFMGCNIENASFGATICAERTAIFKAVSEGERNFKKIAIASSMDDFIMPCGICRQVISELMPSDGQIIISNGKNEHKVYTVEELLPHSFKLGE